MAQDHRPKLSKADQQKHFPEWEHGGKGDRPRSRGRLNNKTSLSDFEENWERIFRGKHGKD